MFKFKEKFQINPNEIDIINNYDYFNDFSNYVIELQSL
jgi:hypothetical protein